MARAPRPGAAPTSGEGMRLRIVVGDGEWILHLDDLGPRDRGEVRAATKETFGAPLLLGDMLGADLLDTDSIAVLWWLARRKDGEPRLKLGRALDELGDNRTLAALLTDGRLVVEQITDDEPETEDGSADPLEPAAGSPG